MPVPHPRIQTTTPTAHIQRLLKYREVSAVYNARVRQPTVQGALVGLNDLIFARKVLREGVAVRLWNHWGFVANVRMRMGLGVEDVVSVSISHAFVK